MISLPTFRLSLIALTAVCLSHARAQSDQVVFANGSDVLSVPAGGGTAALLERPETFLAPQTVRSSGVASSLLLEKVFPSRFTPGEAVLQVQDTASSPDTSGALMKVIANKTYPVGRPVFQVSREGGVQVWDWFAVAPSWRGQYDWLKGAGAMALVGSDLGPTGTNLVLHNVLHHDFLSMWDSDGNSIGIDSPNVANRFTFTGPGLLVFGKKTAASPALRPQGTALAVKTGDDKAYSDVVTARAGVGTGTNALHSTLQVQGSVATPITTVRSAYTPANTDRVILCDATSGAFTVTLPSAVGIQGREYIIKRVNSNNNKVNVSAPAGQSIDGGSGMSLNTPYSLVMVISDGANWFAL